MDPYDETKTEETERASKGDIMNGLVLLGGGARGAFQVGVIQAISDAGIPIDIVTGSSVGAVNASVVAAGQTCRLAHYWLNMGTVDVVSPRVDMWRIHNWRAIAKPGKSLIDILKNKVPWDAIRQGPVQLRVELSNLQTGRHEVVDNRSCTWKHVLASTAIPMIFPPVRVDGQCYVDGSLTQTFPLLPAIEAGADTLYVVGLTAEEPGPGRPEGLYEMAGRTMEIFLHNNLRQDLEQLEKVNGLVRQKASSKHREIKVVPFFPHEDLGELEGFLNFSRKRTEKLIEIGYQEGRKVLSVQTVTRRVV